jgi:ABC-2 type transport system ATP-binding protein
VPETVVRADGLTRRFAGGRGIAGVSFAVARGEVLGFLGPNGAGKSTTLRVLLGLYRADSGRGELFGLDPRRDAVRVNRRIGYLPGELALYPRLTGHAVLDVLARARGLTDRSEEHRLVERFEVELDRPVHTLSKGSRQKIGLVAAFMHRPELLVLDEPTSGLDPLLQAEFVSLVRECAADGRTVLLSSHDLDEVQQVADRVTIIKDGRIVITDTVEGLRGTAPRTIEFRFAAPIAAGAPFAGLAGVRVVEQAGARVLLSYTGSVAPILHVAAGLDPITVTARPVNLDELFLSYYRSRAAVGDAG